MEWHCFNYFPTFEISYFNTVYCGSTSVLNWLRPPEFLTFLNTTLTTTLYRAINENENSCEMRFWSYSGFQKLKYSIETPARYSKKEAKKTNVTSCVNFCFFYATVQVLCWIGSKVLQTRWKSWNSKRIKRRFQWKNTSITLVSGWETLLTVLCSKCNRLKSCHLLVYRIRKSRNEYRWSKCFLRRTLRSCRKPILRSTTGLFGRDVEAL